MIYSPILVSLFLVSGSIFFWLNILMDCGICKPSVSFFVLTDFWYLPAEPRSLDSWLVYTRIYHFLVAIVTMLVDISICQAVVVSIDPRRVYIRNPNDVKFKTIKVSSPGTIFFVVLSPLSLHSSSYFYKMFYRYEFSFLQILGPSGEEYAWYQCTVSLSSHFCFLFYWLCILWYSRMQSNLTAFTRRIDLLLLDRMWCFFLSKWMYRADFLSNMMNLFAWCSLNCLFKWEWIWHRDLFIYIFYWQINGGREGRPIGAYELAKAVEELGAGEILLNCIDCDGK